MDLKKKRKIALAIMVKHGQCVREAVDLTIPDSRRVEYLSVHLFCGGLASAFGGKAKDYLRIFHTLYIESNGGKVKCKACRDLWVGQMALAWFEIFFFPQESWLHKIELAEFRSIMLNYAKRCKVPGKEFMEFYHEYLSKRLRDIMIF